MDTVLREEAVAAALEPLMAANAAFARAHPGERSDRQPVHTVYGGAHLFRADSARRLGELALRSLEEYAPNPESLAGILDLDPEHEHDLYERVLEKLRREPVEDFRIDFEDGYGNRPAEHEDETAMIAATEVARGLAGGTLPPFIGIRIKPFTTELVDRGVRTLDIFVSTLVSETGGALPDNFVVTLPKVVVPEQVTALVDLFERLESDLPLDPGSLKLELMIETPQSIIGSDGRVPLSALVAASRGRCVAAHFGVYDYTASLSITAENQLVQHPVCDMARRIMQVALAGSGVQLSDGATNTLPVPIHRAREGEPALGAAQQAENRDALHAAWRLHYDDVRHSLMNGYYQGWDLHPAQLVTRYAAVYSFFQEGIEAAAERLTGFVAQAAQASLYRDVMDDAATGQALLNFFLRGLASGAVTEEQAAATGLTLDELRSRSFLAILEGRRG